MVLPSLEVFSDRQPHGVSDRLIPTLCDLRLLRNLTHLEPWNGGSTARVEGHNEGHSGCCQHQHSPFQVEAASGTGASCVCTWHMRSVLYSRGSRVVDRLAFICAKISQEPQNLYL